MRKATKSRMRPTKARSGGDDRIEQLETNLKRLEGLAQKVFEEVAAHQETSGLWRSEKVTPSVTVHRWQPTGGEPGAKIAGAVEKKLNGHGLSLKDAAPPTMTTPTRRTVMERLAELETTDELLDTQHRAFELGARLELERLMDRLTKLEAAMGEA